MLRTVTFRVSARAPISASSRWHRLFAAVNLFEQLHRERVPFLISGGWMDTGPYRTAPGRRASWVAATSPRGRVEHSVRTRSGRCRRFWIARRGAMFGGLLELPMPSGGRLSAQFRNCRIPLVRNRGVLPSSRCGSAGGRSSNREPPTRRSPPSCDGRRSAAEAASRPSRT